MTTEKDIENILRYLFAPQEQMDAARLLPRVQERILRIRDMYSYWLKDPRLAERHIAAEIRNKYHISQTKAYEDLNIIKRAIGDMNQCSTEYLRWVFLQRCQEGFKMARDQQDAGAWAKILAVYGKYARLDKDESQQPDYAQIVPQSFEITADPAAAGFKPIPDVEDKTRAMLKKFTLEADVLELPDDMKDAEDKTQTYQVNNNKPLS